MNFAPRVKCPALVALGLLGTGCLAEGVLAACNQLRGRKEIIIMPQSGHGGDHQAYAQANVKFLDSLK